MNALDPTSETISVIVPAYNEARLLPDHLDSIFRYADERPWPTEIVVVDDGSTDATGEIVSQAARADPRIRLLRQPNRGKGAAVRRGMLAATGAVRGFTDADGSTPIQELDRMLEAIANGAAVAIGSRALRDVERPVSAHFHRKAMGRLFHLAVRSLLDLSDHDGRPIADTQCGFKWFAASAAEEIFQRSRVDGFGFDLEVLWLAGRLGFPVVEIPVEWTDRGSSTVNLATEPFRMLRTVVELARRRDAP